MSYLLDTNICIHLFKGHLSLANKIRLIGIDSFFLSEITIAELMYGVENSSPSHRDRNRENIEWLCNAFADRILLIGQGFPEYARQKTSLRRTGKIIGEFDLLIGATAVAYGLTLITHNTQDFARLDKIRLENWID